MPPHKACQAGRSVACSVAGRATGRRVVRPEGQPSFIILEGHLDALWDWRFLIKVCSVIWGSGFELLK